MTTLAIIGIGNVGGALAEQSARHGYDVILAVRAVPSEKAEALRAKNPRLQIMLVHEAVQRANIILLATPFSAVKEALSGLLLEGKILIDCTNPVGPGLTHGLNSLTSGSEFVAQYAPSARVVKCFTIYGYENFIETAYPGYGSLKPAMLIAGDDVTAKKHTADLCAAIGFEAVDCGPLSSSVHLEHMTLLWIKMARVQGSGSNLVWARLRR
jgi:8-hydroxy-5-deazaflavin:NADPH oxidoreductase